MFTQPSSTADQADYQRRQDYSLADTAPLMIEGRAMGRLAVRDLLP